MIIRHSAVDVGAPPNKKQAREWSLTPVRFHGFAGLNATRGVYVESPEFSSCGHMWNVRLYPGGNTNSSQDMVAAYLFNMTDASIKVDYSIGVKCSRGRGVGNHVGNKFNPKHLLRRIISGARGNEASNASSRKVAKRQFGERSSPNNGNGWGRKNFELRELMISTAARSEGVLTIEVRIRLADTSPPALVPFIPANPCSNRILTLFNDEESADVVFEVKNGNQSAIFYAHRLILKQCAPVLGELCGPQTDLMTIPISGVKPAVFRHLLHYIYGGKVAEKELREHAKELIDAADFYEVVPLKLQAESHYVSSVTIHKGNVVDILLYAESKSCALLKEAAMDFVIENGVGCIEEMSVKNAPEEPVIDLLLAVAMELKQRSNDCENSIRIDDLRKKLYKKGLDVDGTKEALIARLEKS